VGFASPLWLLSLLAVAGAALAYAIVQRRPGRYPIRHPALATLARAAQSAGARARWRSHLPSALLLAALAVLGVALARPRETYRVPVGRGSIMLVIDHSGSMAAQDVQPDRLAAAQRAANQFIDRLPSSVKVGVIGFGATPDSVQAPTPDHAIARGTIAEQAPGGSTATGAALTLALQLLHGADRRHPPAAIVLLSDGAANAGVDPVTVARQARAEHIPIYTIALGTPGGQLLIPGYGVEPVPPDPQLMEAIARASGGRAFDAQDAGTLSRVYRDLGDQLGSVPRKRDITLDFALAGLGLLALAGAGAVALAPGLP
jgi:Ca-activated chloride channel family protein